jgi:hypothetical protein
MSAGIPTVFAPAKKKLLTKQFNLSSDALKCALFTNAVALSAGYLGASADARYADISASEVSGTGYTVGGVALASVALTYYVASAVINAAGSGGTNGTQTVTGTTGTGTKFTAQVTVSGGIITAILSITLGGSYSVLPTNPAAEPVTGASLTGATLSLVMGVALSFTNPQWTSATITAKYAVIYDTTATNNDLIAFADLETTVGSGVSTTNGTLIVQLDPSGLLKLL